MKKQILISLIIISSGLTMNAQWNGTVTTSNVGINTNSPTTKLEIVGSSQAGYELGTFKLKSSTAGQFMYFGYDDRYSAGYIQSVKPGTDQQNILLAPAGGNIGIGVNNPDRKLTIGGMIGVNNGGVVFNNNGKVWDISSNGNNLQFNETGIQTPLFLQAGGNIGIGTTTPQQRLDVSGIVRSKTMDLFEDDKFVGFLGRGNLYTGGWSALPNALTLTYASRDFAIGGWRKSDGVWNGASLFINSDNNYIGIGTTTPQYKLDVEGTIRAKEIKVCLQSGCDFVFNKDYKLMSLNELENFVTTKQHLPEIASEKEMIENGLNMKEFQMKLLQKMEEMTLYVIEQNKQLKLQSDKNEKQEEELKILKAEIKKLKSTKR